MIFTGRTLVAGAGEGRVSAIAPLSFWGGVDPETGRIIDRQHPSCGESLAGVVLVMTVGRGSSSASGSLAEALRLGTAPAAIVLAEPDPILLTGALVAEALYGRTVPIVILDENDLAMLARCSRADVSANDDGTGTVSVL